MEQNLKVATIIMLAWWVINYLLISFIELELNSLLWNEGARILYAGAGGICGVCLFLLYYTFKSK